MKWDDNLLEGQNKTLFQMNSSNYGEILWRPYGVPSPAWAFPIVTGHKYKISWATTGIDFESMQMEMSEEWLETDKNVMMIYNFTDVRAEINVTVGGKQIMNDSLPSEYIDDVNMKHGQNVLQN